MDDFADFRDGVEAMNMERAARYIYPVYSIPLMPSVLFINPLWASHKEADYQKVLSNNPNVDCYCYENTGSYALLNNLGEEEKTIFYDIHGKPSEMTLKGHEIRWIPKE